MFFRFPSISLHEKIIYTTLLKYLKERGREAGQEIIVVVLI